MQTGDRIGYHPENAQKEIARFHEELAQAQDAVQKVVESGQKRLNEFAQHATRNDAGPVDVQAEKQKRAGALARAAKLVTEAGK
jgi:hypothetical protein